MKKIYKSSRSLYILELISVAISFGAIFLANIGFSIFGFSFFSMYHHHTHFLSPAPYTYIAWLVVEAFILVYLIRKGILIFRFKALPVYYFIISWPFIFTNLLVTATLICWSLNLILAPMCLILCAFVVLSFLYVFMRRHQSHSRLDSFLVYTPISLYTAWLFFVCIQSVLYFFVSIPNIEFIIFIAPSVLFIVFMTTMFIYKFYGDIAFALMIMWSCFGIFTARFLQQHIVGIAKGSILLNISDIQLIILIMVFEVILGTWLIFSLLEYILFGRHYR